MAPRKSTVSLERSLPPVKNELMLGEVNPAVLSTKCRVQDVRFGPADEDGVTETFVRIKTQIPHAPMPHFIMRKAEDNYVSATSMYRAVFYKSTSAAEKLEMEIVKRDLAARSDENASGVWIPGSPDALQLADVYGIRPWVQALLDAPTTKAAYPEDQRSPSSALTSSPAPAASSNQHSSVSATPSRRSARERSTSPRKTLAATSRKAKKALADSVEAIKEDVDEVTEAVKRSVVPGAKKELGAVVSKVEKEAGKVLSPSSSKKRSKSVAELAETVAPTDKEDEVKYSTTISNHGQSMQDMMAEARAQVESAQSKDAAALSKSGLLSTSSLTKKRELEDDEDEVIKNQIITVKRGRVEDLEIGLVQEKRKVRALFGLVIGLGATAILPYIL